jgi:hypothetical protein
MFRQPRARKVLRAGPSVTFYYRSTVRKHQTYTAMVARICQFLQSQPIVGETGDFTSVPPLFAFLRVN